MGGRYRRPNISEFAEKNLRNFTILAKILFLPISPNFFEIFISNYFLTVMNQSSFSGLTFPNSVFSTFIEYLILRILVIYFMRIDCETPYKIQKLFDISRHFERLRAFHFLNKFFYLCSHIAEFGKKLSAILAPI